MSTLISDLPGPQEEYVEEQDSYQNEYRDNQYQNEYRTNQYHNEYRTEECEEFGNDSFENENDFKAKIIKKHTIDIDFKDELNLENLLLFCMLFIVTLPQFNETIRKVLGIFIGSGYSHGFITVIKCILMVVLFILVKKFVLV
jgi:hypothetical protein